MRPYDSLDSVRRGAATMIARIWRGWTTPANADAYQRIVCQEVLPGIAARNLEGYHGAYLLRRDLDGEVEFATILLFDSLEQVRAFAGEDYETAYVPPRTGGAGPLRRALSPLRHAVTAAHDLTRPGRRAGRCCVVQGAWFTGRGTAAPARPG